MKIRHTAMGLALCAVVLLNIGAPAGSSFAEETVAPAEKKVADPAPAPAPTQAQPQTQPQSSAPAADAPPAKPSAAPSTPAAPAKPAPAPAMAGEVKTGDVLTVDRCVKIALERHPAIIAAAHSA